MKADGSLCRMAFVTAAALPLSPWLFPDAGVKQALAVQFPPGVRVQQAKHHPALRPLPLLAQLSCVSECGKEVYEAAKANKMDATGRRAEELKKHAAYFKHIRQEDSTILYPPLSETIYDLEEAIGGKNRLEIMRLANRVTLIAATLSVPYKPRVPTEIVLLDFYARELAIWSETRKVEKLAGIVGKMHLIWQRLIPKIIENGGVKTVRKFSDLMGRLKQARTVEEYAQLALQVDTEIDGLDKIFVGPKK